MFKSITIFGTALAAFMISGSLAAKAEAVESTAQIPSVAVSYADLNLDTAAGVEALYARLRAASRSVCNVGEGRGLVAVMAAKVCYREVLGAAVGDAKLPTLTALHRTETAHDGHS